jgi:hypothetical protein
MDRRYAVARRDESLAVVSSQGTRRWLSVASACGNGLTALGARGLIVGLGRHMPRERFIRSRGCRPAWTCLSRLSTMRAHLPVAEPVRALSAGDLCSLTAAKWWVSPGWAGRPVAVSSGLGLTVWRSALADEPACLRLGHATSEPCACLGPLHLARSMERLASGAVSIQGFTTDAHDQPQEQYSAVAICVTASAVFDQTPTTESRSIVERQGARANSLR